MRHGSRADSARLFHGEVHSPVLQLQRMLGNQRVAQLIQAKRLTPQGKIIGLQPKQTVGAADDRYEQEADRVARQVMTTPNAVVGAPARQPPSLIGHDADSALVLQGAAGNAAVGRMLNHPIQRFGEKEHRNIGDWATNRGYVRLGDKGYVLSYGEMVALAGDLFPSLDYMVKLANKPGKGPDSQEALDYARYIKVGRRRQQDARTTKQTVEDDMNSGFPGEEARYDPNSYSPATRKAVDEMYYKLAVNNASHFNAPRGKDAGKEWQDRPGASGHNYRSYHERALRLAYQAGRTGGSTAAAVAAEAFGGHFLTDAVSSGHLRTPRLDIIEHWEKRDTGFVNRFKGYMMTQVSEWILSNTKLGKGLGPGMIYTVVADGIDKALAGRPSLTLGILVALAVHDYDNKRGLSVLTNSKPAVVYGDRYLEKGDTERIAISAVRAGLKEVHEAYSLGSSVKTFDKVKARLLGGGTQYKPEKIIPRLNPAKGDQDMPIWKVETFDDLLADTNMRNALELTIMNNVSEIASIAKGMKEPARSGILHGFADLVRADPIRALKGIYHYKESPSLDIRNMGQMGVDIPTH